MTRLPRVLSLIPSATDWVTDLGLAEQLVGITHECAAPGSVPVVVTPAVHNDPGDPSGVDAAVSAAAQEGRALYAVDEDLVTELAPTIILTQRLCEVCAVASGDLHRLVQRLDRCVVVELDGVTLDGVLDDGLRVAGALDVPRRGEALDAALRARVAQVSAAVADAPRPGVAFLEWPDPPWVGGHWVPDQIAAAGGAPTAGVAGAPSSRAPWEAFAGADVLIVGPCGYGLDEAFGAAAAIAGRLPAAGQVWAVDAHHHFSRPAPGLVDGIEALGGILHPDRLPAPSPALAKQL